MTVKFVIWAFSRKLKWIFFFGTVMIGFVFGTYLQSMLYSNINFAGHCNTGIYKYVQLSNQNTRETLTFDLPKPSNIFIGMMSARKFIASRVQRALNTWLQKGQWTIEIFTDGELSLLSIPSGVNLKIVNLPSVDDKSYPPQKKCFMMLRYMFDKYIDDYEWFIRADDDVYINYAPLVQLLNTVNSSMPIFFGSPGFGMDLDDGMENGMYYLMGGPGIILSRGLLLIIRSHLSYCIQHMFSPHEDIELGRCVWKYVKNAIIPKAWEVIEYFYQQYDKITGDVVNVMINELPQTGLSKIIGYHSLKTNALTYQMHKLILENKIRCYVNKTRFLKKEIQTIDGLVKIMQIQSLHTKFSHFNLPSIINIKEVKRYELPQIYKSNSVWLFYFLMKRQTLQIGWNSWNKHYCHQVDSNIPIKGHTKREKFAVWHWINGIKNQLVNTCPKKESDYEFITGYFKVTLNNGLLIVTIFKHYSKYGEKYCSVMGYYGYGIEFFNEVAPNLLNVVQKRKQILSCTNSALQFSFSDYCSSAKAQKVVLVVPLQGRYHALKEFLERYEKNFLIPLSKKNAPLKTQLVIVLMGDNYKNVDLKEAASNLLLEYQNLYGPSLLRYHEVNTGSHGFSRGAGIQLGSLAAEPDDILFFMDVDMIVTPNLIEQCYKHSLKGISAWYPISFSQYNPEKICSKLNFTKNKSETFDLNISKKESFKKLNENLWNQNSHNPYFLTENTGFWRDFGFGITCMYKCDFIQAGGFDLSIEGWGEEDVDMYLSLIKSGIDVFRSKQVDLIHIFHEKLCDVLLKKKQHDSCISTKASHYASQLCLAETFFERSNFNSII